MLLNTKETQLMKEERKKQKEEKDKQKTEKKVTANKYREMP